MYKISEGLKKALDKRKKTTEGTIEDYFVGKVEDVGGVAIKIRLIRGFPDRVVLLPGGVCEFVELKRPVGGKFEPLQTKWHARLRKLGFVVVVLRDKPAVDSYLGTF